MWGLKTAEKLNGSAKLTRSENMFFWYVLSYCKFFDEKLPVHDKDNYYMEREWRTIGKIDFCPRKIAKVILPQEFKC